MTSGKYVTFSCSIIHYILEDKDWKEYRKSDQLAVIADKIRFKRRIEHLNDILSPFLLRKLKNNGILWPNPP